MVDEVSCEKVFGCCTTGDHRGYLHSGLCLWGTFMFFCFFLLEGTLRKLQEEPEFSLTP